MTEYSYKRGVGWVLGPSHKVLEFDKGDGWWLICENRKPEPGEDYFREHSFEYSAKNLGNVNYWKLNKLQNIIGQDYYHGTGPEEHTCVFRLEKRS